MLELKNENLTVQFSELGGQIISIKDKDGIEYLWQGDPTYWSGQAPVLFPICG
ncbi:TPA: aldose 1-epimerase family protein, partial [Streptococcus suis]